MKQPITTVGIMHADHIRFTLHTLYYIESKEAEGMQEAVMADGEIEWNGCHFSRLHFTPANRYTASFTLHDVCIGKDFHWQRNESQTFKGALSIIVEDGRLCAVNHIEVEDYLVSVIASEMKATAPLEFLKAHAVISRSWLLRQMAANTKSATDAQPRQSAHCHEHIRWYDRESHQNYDVCADDHCQRYQGITRATTHDAQEAVKATAGMVLTHNGDVCDTRFSKCCGGISEVFSTCWEDTEKPYLTAIRDSWKKTMYDLKTEENAHQWINSMPDAYCNTANRELLSTILNDYDTETHDFYRWRVKYSQTELSDIIRRKTNIDIGTVEKLIPLSRGQSGRIYRMSITGSAGEIIIGKELEIRRALSDTHLLSSAFTVERDGTEFILHGAGWGHGVGLCQIGAAVMASEGYDFRAILSHYYKHSTLTTLYETESDA